MYGYVGPGPGRFRWRHDTGASLRDVGPRLYACAFYPSSITTDPGPRMGDIVQDIRQRSWQRLLVGMRVCHPGVHPGPLSKSLNPVGN